MIDIPVLVIISVLKKKALHFCSTLYKRAIKRSVHIYTYMHTQEEIEIYKWIYLYMQIQSVRARKMA